MAKKTTNQLDDSFIECMELRVRDVALMAGFIRKKQRIWIEEP